MVPDHFVFRYIIRLKVEEWPRHKRERQRQREPQSDRILGDLGLAVLLRGATSKDESHRQHRELWVREVLGEWVGKKLEMATDTIYAHVPVLRALRAHSICPFLSVII